MRILVALTYYHPHWTGLTVYARTIAEGMAERGHQVTVLTSQHDPDLPVDEVVDGVRVLRCPTAGRLSRAMVVPRLPVDAWRLAAEHDVVHIHTPMPEAGLLTAIAHARGRPVVVTHQGDVVMPAGAANRVVQGAMAVTLGRAVRRANAVTTHSADYAEHSRLLADRGRPVVAIPPPTTIPLPRPERVAARRAELGLGSGPVVGFAGRFVEEKGFDYLLRAVPGVLAQIPTARFVFAGETDVAYERFYDRCRHLVDAHRDAISILGLLDRQEMADFYAMADVFVLPSRTDCFAAVQVEALLCGTPVIAADIPGARDVVRTTGMGRLTRPGDVADLARAITAELQSPRPRPDRATVARRYDPSAALDRYEAVLHDPQRATDDAGAAGRGTAVPVHRSARTAEQAAVAEHLLANESDLAFRRRVLRLLELLDLEPGDRLLDAGCGMGVVSMVVGRAAAVTPVAVDADRRRLDWAQAERVPAHLCAADVTRLPFPDASFDKVLSSEVLEHLDDDGAGLREIRRVLRPGGIVAISVPHANYPRSWDPLNRALEAMGAPPWRGRGPITGQWSGHQRLYLPAALRDAVTAADLELEVLEEQTPYTVPFNHVAVYGIGKGLIEHGLLPRRLRDAADRFRAEDNPRSMWNPVNLAVRGLRRADRRNDRLRGDESRFVGIVARARRPVEP